MERRAGLVASCCCVALLWGCAVSSSERRPAVIGPPGGLRSGRASLSDVAERALRGVVNIASTKVIATRRSPFFSDPFFREFFGGRHRMPRARRQRSLGSGVIVSHDGVVLTNNHVIAGASEIRVRLADGRELAAKVLGSDRRSDLAVLRLMGEPKDLEPLSFGDSDYLRLGDVVLAIGNPFGVGQTVTMGIVSAKGRANVGIVDYEDFIQTDAAINPGNSGGALVNARGELVGINTAILSRSGGYQGIGFAIPAKMARQLMTSILRHGRVVRGWMGVVTQDLTPELAKALGIPGARGVLVADVQGEGPAAKAGLRRGDVLLAVGGSKLTSRARFRSLVASSGAGSEVKVEVLRAGKRLELKVTLVQMPTSAGGVARVRDRGGALGGLTVLGLSDAVRDKYRIPRRLKVGVVVDKVQRHGAAASAGLQPGDVILEINRQVVRDVGGFARLYNRAPGRVLLLVYRGGRTHYLLLSR